MTAQPHTTPDTTAMPTWGTPAPGADPYLTTLAPAGYPNPYGAPPPAPKRSVAKIVSIVSAAVVAIVGLATGALFLFGPKTVDPQSVQQEIVRITQTAVGVVPTDIRCPDKIKAEAGGTFACTAAVDQQPVTYAVRQDDDKGHLTINYDRLIKMADVEKSMATQVGKDVGVDVTIGCEPNGRTVVVNKPGTPVACTVTNATDPTDAAKINVSIDADGLPSYTWA